MIDPGHGGSDTGTTGKPLGVLEKRLYIKYFTCDN